MIHFQSESTIYCDHSCSLHDLDRVKYSTNTIVQYTLITAIICIMVDIEGTTKATVHCTLVSTIHSRNYTLHLTHWGRSIDYMKQCALGFELKSRISQRFNALDQVGLKSTLHNEVYTKLSNIHSLQYVHHSDVVHYAKKCFLHNSQKCRLSVRNPASSSSYIGASHNKSICTQGVSTTVYCTPHIIVCAHTKWQSSIFCLHNQRDSRNNARKSCQCTVNMSESSTTI